jgi:AcrR family transcriptional regulator
MEALPESKALARAVGEPETPFSKLRPGPGQSASDVAADQRARIQKAMIEMVAERGYETVKIRELVLLAGVSS